MAAFPRARTVTSGTRAASGNSGPLGLGDDTATSVALLVNVTAQAGTSPTLALSVEWSLDGTTFYAGDPADAFTQIGAATPKVAKTFQVRAPMYRLVWVLGGTSPSYTFTVDQYA